MTKKEDSKRARNRGEIDREGEKGGGGAGDISTYQKETGRG